MPGTAKSQTITHLGAVSIIDFMPDCLWHWDMTAITLDQMTLSIYHTINKQYTRQYHTNQAGEAVTDCEREYLIMKTSGYGFYPLQYSCWDVVDTHIYVQSPTV